MKHQNTLAKEHWHAFEKEDIFSQLESSENGIQSTEATARLQFYGENKLQEGKRVTIWQIVLHQLLNPLIFILV